MASYFDACTRLCSNGYGAPVSAPSAAGDPLIRNLEIEKITLVKMVILHFRLTTFLENVRGPSEV